MSIKNKKDPKLVEIGKYIRKKRESLQLGSRDEFISDRSENLFGYEQWISLRYLTSIELGDNQMSLEKMIKLAYALEIDPKDMFAEILKIYIDDNS